MWDEIVGQLADFTTAVVTGVDDTGYPFSLRCKPDLVELRVGDDGRGFNPDDVPPKSLGVGIMRERAEKIGATLEIESQEGVGTQVTVVWTRDGHTGRKERHVDRSSAVR